MKQGVRFFNEAMGSGATPAQIHTNISKALKSAGFKVKKFKQMSSGHGGVWGGFYTVGDGMVLPFHVKKDGMVSYDAGPKDWIIGNIDYVDVMTRILKQVKKTPDYGQSKLSKVRRTKKIASESSSSLVKKAIDIAKKMGGNMTGAVEKIEKLQRGLAKDSEVEKALQTANESMDEAVVASMRTSSGQRDLEKKGGKLIMKMPSGEVLKFKDGADVKEYMDRVYGYWSFIKGYGKVKGLRESTAAYEKALQQIAKDKQLSMLSKKDRETLLKVAKLMKSANEDEKWSGLGYDSFEGEKMDEKVAMPLGDHLNTATKELDYMIKVGPIEDAYDSPKASFKAIKLARKLLDKVN